jgi:hypothetical protein
MVRSESTAALTVSAGLDGCLNIPDALHGDAVLVVTIDILVFELANFVEKDTEFVSDIGDVFVTSLSPYRELLLRREMSPTTTSIRGLRGVISVPRPPCAPWRLAQGFA